MWFRIGTFIGGGIGFRVKVRFDFIVIFAGQKTVFPISLQEPEAKGLRVA